MKRIILHNCMSVIDNENGFEGAVVDKKSYKKSFLLVKLVQIVYK